MHSYRAGLSALLNFSNSLLRRGPPEVRGGHCANAGVNGSGSLCSEWCIILNAYILPFLYVFYMLALLRNNKWWWKQYLCPHTFHVSRCIRSVGNTLLLNMVRLQSVECGHCLKYTVSQKKTHAQTFVNVFANYGPIFKISSLLHYRRYHLDMISQTQSWLNMSSVDA